MKPLKEYRIPFLGLKLGKHEYEFHLTQKFFEVFEYSEIEIADINVSLQLEKQQNMMVAHFQLKGTVQVACDHCGDEFQQPLKATHSLLIKFGESTSEPDDEVLILGPQEYELDISHFLYEYAHLAMPARHVHPSDSQCNQQAVQALNRYKVDTTASTQWAELKNLNYEDPEDNPDFDQEEE
ncbi:MAG: YceD family protein [Flavobacteriales bacterium]